MRVWTDRTTLYPGDRLNYVVRVEHPPDIEFVQDHVRKDQLSLEPFEVLDVSTATGDLPGGRKFFEVKLLLTTYDASHPDATMPIADRLHFRHLDRPRQKQHPETLAVPPLKIGLRTTIVDPPGNIRDDKPVLPVSQMDWILPGVLGVCGLVAVIIITPHSSRWRGSVRILETQNVRARSPEVDARSFDEIRRAPVDSRESAEGFYAKASAILRGMAAEKLGECGGLTPREMQAALRKSGDREDHAEAVGDLMEQCDLVRYSPDGLERARTRHSQFLQKFEELVERR